MSEIPNGYMMTTKGDLRPIEKVQTAHILEDEVVRKLHELAVPVSESLSELKATSLEEVKALRDILAEEHGVKKGGAEGNVTLRSYDGRLKVDVSVAKVIEYGAQLATAKQLLDEYIGEVAADLGDDIRQLIDLAFKAGKSGQINKDRIRALLNLQNEHPTWQRAMACIRSAEREVEKRTYVRLYSVDPATGEETPVRLDLASV